MADIENEAFLISSSVQETIGKDSVIASYCKTAVAAHKEECFWICYSRHGRTLAKDIVVATEDNSIDELAFRLCNSAYQYGWWKRFSIYSAVGVKEVEMFFRTASHDGIVVIMLPADHSTKLSIIEQEIRKYQAKIRVDTCCGVDQHGIIHRPSSPCPNESWNEHDEETYCPLEKIYALRSTSEKTRCAAQMLEFYWGVRSESDCLAYLRDQGFVYSYRGLQECSYTDHFRPQGRSVKALYLVDGWHLRYLSCLVAASVVISVCVIAIVTLIKHDAGLGLAAGSYTTGVAAVLLAVLSILSVIL